MDRLDASVTARCKIDFKTARFPRLQGRMLLCSGFSIVSFPTESSNSLFVL